MPPSAQIANDDQYGNPVHQPIITRPGSTKMIDDSVPAAEATVCTMLFSWTVESRKPRSSAIEMTAAGIDVANVRPALRPKNTFAAVNTIVMIDAEDQSSQRHFGAGSAGDGVCDGRDLEEMTGEDLKPAGL